MIFPVKTEYWYLIVIWIVISLCSWETKGHLQAGKIPVDGYDLVWHDEFNGKNLDKTKWNYSLGKRKDAYNTKQAVFLDGNGFLHLQVRLSGDSVLAGMISTDRLFETKFGYFECRAKLPDVSGTWPAFWLLSDKTGADYGTPETNGVEIDIFEYFPNYKKDTVTHNLHWGGYGPTQKELGFVAAPMKKTNDGFHVFGLEWTDSTYTAFVDGIQTAKGYGYISRIPEYLILSMECSIPVAGPLNKIELPADFIIDYVRVYKKAGNQ